MIKVIDLGTDEVLKTQFISSMVLAGPLELMLLNHDGELLLAEQMVDDDGFREGLPWTTKGDRGRHKVIKFLGGNPMYAELLQAALKGGK